MMPAVRQTYRRYPVTIPYLLLMSVLIFLLVVL